MPETGASGPYGALWDWRRRVAALYAKVRNMPEPEAAWHIWRQTRDALLRDHAQSPLDRPFRPLSYFAYDPALRFTVGLSPMDGGTLTLDLGGDGAIRLRSFARTAGLAATLGQELTMFWVEGYGGGVFLPFLDGTSGRETYGAGRYLLDTIKGADLGEGAGGTVLDFNFAYNPSCSYSDRYVCPLSPAENRLAVPVRAGEMYLEA